MSTAYLHSLDTGELREIQTELRTELPDFASIVASKPKKKQEPKRFDLGNGFYYTHNETYFEGYGRTHNWQLSHEKKKGSFHFKQLQYPACCGISILHNFYGWREAMTEDDVNELVKRFFEQTGSGWWQPNIQFIAVRDANEWETIESECSSDDDEDWYDEECDDSKPIAWNTDYNVSDFINALRTAFNPTLISSFVNSNSGNTCDVYQFATPYTEE